MKLNSAQLERTLGQFEARAIPNDHPDSAAQRLSESPVWFARRSPTDFVSSFTGRVQALAKAHTCSPRTKMQGADVMELVSEQVLIGAPNDSQTLDHLCGVCVRVRLLYFHRK
jgi:hypothetical protein